MTILSGIVVAGFGLFLIGLAVMAGIRPALVRRFLLSFAGSARAHYTEMTLRLFAGAALTGFASSMWYPDVFTVFGWVLILTTAGLMLIPWQWHHKFAEWSVPRAIQYLGLFAAVSFSLGLFLFYGMSRAIWP